MKMFKRIISVLLVLCVLVSLCSCKQLDNAKRNQAFYTDETTTRVKFGDSYYGLIDLGEYSLGVNCRNKGFITESDVPVMLSGILGTGFVYDNDKIFIKVYDGMYYCREDKYNEYSEMFKNPVFTKCFYENDFYDDISHTFKTERIKIDYNEFLTAVDDAKSQNMTMSTDMQKSTYAITSRAISISDENELITDFFCAVEVYGINGKTFYLLRGNSEIDEGIILPEQYNYLFEGIKDDYGSVPIVIE